MFTFVGNQILFNGKVVAGLVWGLDAETKAEVVKALEDGDNERGELYDQGWNDCIAEYLKFHANMLEDFQKNGKTFKDDPVTIV